MIVAPIDALCLVFIFVPQPVHGISARLNQYTPASEPWIKTSLITGRLGKAAMGYFGCFGEHLFNLGRLTGRTQCDTAGLRKKQSNARVCQKIHYLQNTVGST
jgi:hypothetical protein